MLVEQNLCHPCHLHDMIRLGLEPKTLTQERCDPLSDFDKEYRLIQIIK